ncbi:PepSY domain-containing protein [Paracoccus tegillarcae]|uniref:PepSY domain-containing protein n=1 Tax=Paracoccus tegillarcae TaxID=1529068 RepID=A0A2K9ES73_9RHOB|nr:PepSY domain-containing protein [Paracoccus tegillarcae]AUH33656.1 hypothetical protein CUV01_09880 [Paracoccus tegillarcae]
MFTKIAIAAALLTFAGAASAQSIDRQIRDQLRGQGFTNVQIERDDGKIAVDARRGNQKIELEYDTRTGRLLKQDSQRLSRQERRIGSWRSDDDDDDDGRSDRGRASNDEDDDDGRSGRGRSGGGGGNDDDD